jgi:4-diphosphocytidyl-2-C-methyl-D-erythritol kinase
MGGGLGGGSSDAATCSSCLNRLWETGFDDEALGRSARAGRGRALLRAGRRAWVEGIGDRCALDLPPAWYVVRGPAVSVPTASIYAAPELTREHGSP